MKRRNVLLIVVDQWRGDTLPILGHPCIKTPHVDTLCREGVTFARHFSQASPCGPARASLLTGLYLMNHRAVQNTIPLDARHRNLAHYARAAGYDPALVGYTTTTPDPRVAAPDDPRFRTLGDLMDGWRAVGAIEPNYEGYFAWVAAQGYALPDDPFAIWGPRDREAAGDGATDQPAMIPAELSDTAWATERALTYLRGRGEQPWFLHLGYYRPHPPFRAPAPFHDMYDPSEVPAPRRAANAEVEGRQHPLLRFYLDTIERKSFFQQGRGLARDMGEGEVRQMRAQYYGLMSEIDVHLGRLFRFLKDTGQWDDTLIVFTCDHGEQLGDHHLLGKVGYGSESFHIPMIVRDPTRGADATRGNVVRQFTETVDTVPTILEWLGQPVPRACDGRSLVPFLRGEVPADWRRAAFYEFDFRNVFYSQPEQPLGLAMDQCSLAVREDADFKYVHFAALPPLLFDLRADPGQMRNMADDPAYQTALLAQAQAMLSWRLTHAERTLTGYAASPGGLIDRGPGGRGR